MSPAKPRSRTEAQIALADSYHEWFRTWICGNEQEEANQVQAIEYNAKILRTTDFGNGEVTRRQRDYLSKDRQKVGG